MSVMYVLLLIGLGFLIGRTLSMMMEAENERLKAALVEVECERKKEQEKYKERVDLLCCAIDNYEKSKRK